MLDLFCGRGGWTDAFLARGWEVVGVDIVHHPDYKGEFVQANVLDLSHDYLRDFDFVCASSPCERFSVHGLRCFYPDPPYPELGICLFNHTRAICEASGAPYVMENVRAAQQFVGNAVNHCGPFYLWGSGVPPLMPQGIRKGARLRRGGYKTQMQATTDSKAAALAATIPPELAGCVADYAERVLCVV